MKKPDGYDESQAFTGEFETLDPGGKILKIRQGVIGTSTTGKEMLNLLFDIAEGEEAGYYQRQFDGAKKSDAEPKWKGVFRQLTEGKSLPFFKGVITAIEQSNPGYKWNWDEKSLAGKLFGGVFGQEEYLASDGKVKTSTKCMFIRSIDKIRAGIEAPPIKKLTNVPATNSSVSNADDGDLPF
jgi:hypothetical protein